MPCRPSKCRHLLHCNRATIVSHTPFTIQLKYQSGSCLQDVSIGVDSGQRHIGLAVTSNEKVLWQGEVTLRQNVKSLLDTRHMYRHTRRQRHTRYRMVRFSNRKPRDIRLGVWLPPSVRQKCEHNIQWINRVRNVLPQADISIEVAKFDVQKLKDPTIHGIGYQQGDAFGYENVKQYVLERDEHTCQLCKRKIDTETKKTLKLHIHHIVYRSKGGTNAATNLLTVCTKCHTDRNHRAGGPLYALFEQKKTIPPLKNATFMNMLRNRLLTAFPEAHFTYGYITTVQRKKLGLAKAHYRDAVAISGIQQIIEEPNSVVMFDQFRTKKRSLHEATARRGRKQKNVTQKRVKKNTKKVKGWCLNDYVRISDGRCGFITGFSGLWMAHIRDRQGGLVKKLVSLTKLAFLHHTGTWRCTTLPTDVYDMQ